VQLAHHIHPDSLSLTKPTNQNNARQNAKSEAAARIEARQQADAIADRAAAAAVRDPNLLRLIAFHNAPLTHRPIGLVAQRAEAAARAEAVAEAAFAGEVEARVGRGMIRTVARGRTTADMQRLSHEHARGAWRTVETHWGVAEPRWVGCCGGLVRDAFCPKYTNYLPPAEAALRAREQAAAAAAATEAAARVAVGMPLAVAAGETKARRQYLSHTGCVCGGLPRCTACKGAFDGNIWSCCRGSRPAMWCTRYEGPQI
jgi:hypothetical protein